MHCRTFSHASYGEKKGCAIFSKISQQISKTQHNIVKDKYQIMSILDETVKGYPYQLVLVYASSGCPLPELVTDLARLLKQKWTTIITGDFNFDRKEENALTRFLSYQDYQQVVTWPTHDGAGNTLDHCYISKYTRVQLTRSSPHFSDHDSLIIQFEHFPWY